MQRDPRHIAALERQGTDAEQSFEDSILLGTFASAYFRHAENSYYQHHFGVYDDDQFAAEVAQFKLALMDPYYAENWSYERESHGLAFREFVDDIVAELPAQDRKLTL